MLPPNVLTAITPLLMAMPISKELEGACKEVSKEIRKKAKTQLAKDLTDKFFDGVVCKQAGKLGQTMTKAATGTVKKGSEKIKKDVEKEIEKKGAVSAKGVALTGLRDDLDSLKKQREAFEQGKPIKLPRPMGGGLHVPFKFKVLSRDKIELTIELFFGVDLKQVQKGKLQINYGLLNVGGRF